jgi:hypothetical protein
MRMAANRLHQVVKPLFLHPTNAFAAYRAFAPQWHAGRDTLSRLPASVVHLGVPSSAIVDKGLQSLALRHWL